MNDAELEKLRRWLEWSQRYDQARRIQPTGQAGRSTMIGRITTAAGPSLAVGKMLTVQPQTLAASNTEGSAPTFTDQGPTLTAYHMGPTAPATNDKVILWRARNRWICRKGAGAAATPTGAFSSGCVCASAPTPIYLHVSTEGGDGIFYSATLTYTSAPCTGGGAPYRATDYFSTTSFVDSLFGETYYYYMICISGLFSLGVVYPTSIFGSCFSYEIYRWSIGVDGSTCSPFALLGGSNMVGTTTATITETP